ncbi:L-idonate 5-dehydrogenase [Micrococcales bacterium 31B]|nr:L-idonate 5-dehydrogenase [Micrococcales bacterium 31B]
MRAVKVYGAGDLRIEDAPAPALAPQQARVRMEWGGICGSDLSYWRTGGAGTNTLTQPMILGHEVAGVVVELGAVAAGLTTAQVGDRVAIHPATLLDYTGAAVRADGRHHLHPHIEHLGSAALTPHTDGGFCTEQAINATQLRVLPAGVDTRCGAIAEPLGVAMHAVGRAGDVRGKTVLVSGCGPIGALVTAVAAAQGAHVIAADVQESSARIAAAMGAREVCVVGRDDLPTDVDLTIEASGAAAAIAPALAATRRGGVLVQVGNLPTRAIEVSLGQLVTREIDYRGSYRFIDEITDAIALLAAGLDVTPIMTHEFDLDDAQRAFETAADRSTGSSKVLLRLSAAA